MPSLLNINIFNKTKTILFNCVIYKSFFLTFGFSVRIYLVQEIVLEKVIFDVDDKGFQNILICQEWKHCWKIQFWTTAMVSSHVAVRSLLFNDWHKSNITEKVKWSIKPFIIYVIFLRCQKYTTFIILIPSSRFCFMKYVEENFSALECCGAANVVDLFH